MRSAVQAALVVAIVVALSVVLALRTARDREPPRAEPPALPPAASIEPAAPEPAGDAPTAVVTGVVSGRYGPIEAVLIVARAGGEDVAKTMTGSGGHYRIEVPAGREIELDVLPIPENELDPARKLVLPLAGEELTVDFDLAKGGIASGTVGGGDTVNLTIVGIRVEDYPVGSDPPSIGVLEAAPKAAARTTGVDAGEWGVFNLDTRFEFRGLDPTATYRLAVLDRNWALERPVFFRAGDNGIVARVVRVLRIFVEATDLGTGRPIPGFRVTLANKAGTVLDTFESEDGRVSRCLPHPAWVSSLDDRPTEPSDVLVLERLRRRASGKQALDKTWELLVHADGYVDERVPAEGIHRIALRRAREPNVLLRTLYEDGMPCDTEIEARFESIDDPDGLLDAVTVRVEPGAFRTTLPPGKWRLHVKRPKAFQDVTQVADVDVPEDGTAEATIRYRRGGTVTFEVTGVEGSYTGRGIQLRREGDEYGNILTVAGTYEDVPTGVYHVMEGEDETLTFEVVAGSTQVVRIQKRQGIRVLPPLPEPEGED